MLPGIRTATFDVGPATPRMQRTRAGQRSSIIAPSSVPSHAHVLHFDGAARGNPGPAGSGAVLFAPVDNGGGVVWAGSSFVGQHATNNVA
eukprot:8489195-Karenia_brevis.AAC.1